MGKLNNISSMIIATSVIMICCAHELRKKSRRKRKKWLKTWLARRDEGKGILNMLNSELLVEDPEAYRNFLRVTSTQFNSLLCLIENKITKQDTNMRQCISARSKLEVTLRFLATGETFRSLMYATRIHESTLSRFIPEVCAALIDSLKSSYLVTPTESEKWKQISDEFFNLWQFPHCLGALDGKHINFRAPISDGSYYYNYKGSNSIVLLGLADARYRFIYVNLGVNGRISDGGVFSNSALSTAIRDNSLDLPKPEPLLGQNTPVPYVIVADDAFPLMPNLMKPYPDRGLSRNCRIFNYRLSRARRIIENAFGILSNRFRILLNTINLCVEKTQLITLTCVVLHNFLATNNPAYSEDIENLEQSLPGLGRQCSNRSSNIAQEVRNKFKEFFNSPEGHVLWQENAINNFNLYQCFIYFVCILLFQRRVPR